MTYPTIAQRDAYDASRRVATLLRLGDILTITRRELVRRERDKARQDALDAEIAAEVRASWRATWSEFTDKSLGIISQRNPSIITPDDLKAGDILTDQKTGRSYRVIES